MNYKQAVEFAVDALEGFDTLPDEADKLAAMVLHFVEKGEDASYDHVIEASDRQALSYDALSRVVARLLAHGQLPPSRLRAWAVEALTGKRERPKVSPRFKTGWPGQHVERDLMIYDTVVALEARGMLATRNDTTSGGSGCDAVADAARKLGVPRLSYSAVKKVYMKTKRKIANNGDPWVSVDTVNNIIMSTKYF